MTIDLSAKEYRDLLDILHIADVVMSGHRREEDQRTVRHRALIQKLYGLAHSEHIDSLISYNENLNRYVPSGEFERQTLAHTVIDEYGDHLFWDQLISRLSGRDAAQMAGGTDHLNALNEGDRQRIEGPIRQRYIEEFTSHGVSNLEIIERFGSDKALPVKTSD